MSPHGASARRVCRCRHFAGRKPFCLEERLINLAAVPDAADESFADIAPGPWLIGRVPWSAAEHTIRATSARPDTRLPLDMPQAACLVVERRTWSADQPVTLVRSPMPATATRWWHVRA